MDISVDIFKQNKIKYDWRTLYVGLKMDLIKYSDVVNYAVEFLTEHPDISDENIVQLAWGGADIDYESLLVDILKELHINELNLDAEVWQLEKRKWRFGILAYLKMKHQDDLEELLNKVAEVYADFNYPEDMDSFINYLEPKDGFNPSQYSKEENVTRLINLFYDFMNKEYHYLQNDNID
ncbi:DUF2247 family protein [Halalkalibacterium halodurans]|uniref:DUF2247 family protein n=2 Tax=Halalkalibacterium halodurans TaxID=86665 RepID=UPI002E1B10C9|nr:DUF2247 family protein [Halalkalibacterium halodurans]MED4087133.1 DUF2247 family protein [Halalkalibacterium halodurans]MED4105943.1 DUF2247 family protein [Halalkalibacterium halodurans]MED4110938.1 DUF2247 family protein [Halalkalibacterium halodurans]MED4125922.1 DUF2247 family protein [Halalkalibacterium halodurans]